MWHQVPFFESLVLLNLGLKPGLPGHWRTLVSYIYIYIVTIDRHSTHKAMNIIYNNYRIRCAHKFKDHTQSSLQINYGPFCLGLYKKKGRNYYSIKHILCIYYLLNLVFFKFSSLLCIICAFPKMKNKIQFNLWYQLLLFIWMK